ncbi:acyl-CoA oxidase, partial [Ramicandelaber brevisporus]
MSSSSSSSSSSSFEPLPKLAALTSLKPGTPDGPAALNAERANLPFDKRLVAQWISGPIVDNIQRIIPTLEKNPDIHNPSSRHYNSRKERIFAGLEMDAKMIKLARKEKWSTQDITAATILTGRWSQFSLHYTGFVPAIQGLGGPEQQAKYLKAAEDLAVIGCYAQTEIGHGSNLAKLETTATFIPETDEFEIHSPSLTASKWWIGSLGLVATHAVVMARLIIDGSNYGPHAFIVPIRDVQTHEALPGVTVGDIGPKFGFADVDNGFVLFDRVRIPRSEMLNRFVQVTREGEYIPASNAKLLFGFMTLTRVNIFMGSASDLSIAATIATRYALVRHQNVGAIPKANASGDDGDEEKEWPVLDYPAVQYRLLPVVAQAYAHILAGKALSEQYQQFVAELADGDMSNLAEIHAASSCLKATGSTIAVDALETCRRSMGGHGYHMASGLAERYANQVPSTTYEGDNILLSQQTGRFLAKAYPAISKAVLSGKIKSIPEGNNGVTTQYIKQYISDKVRPSFKIENHSDVLKPETQLALFGYRAAWHAEHIAALAQKHGKEFIHHGQIRMIRAQEAHGLFIILRSFWAAVRSLQAEPSAQPAFVDSMRLLANVYAVSTLDRFQLADLLESG